MPNIQTSCERFSMRHFSVNKRRQRQNFSVFQILRAIATVGLQSSSSFKSSDVRVRTFRLRTGLSVLALFEEVDTDLVVSAVFDELDASEKAVVSYWLGVAFAKLLANSELRIPWLAHVDPLIRAGSLSATADTKSRGDFVGLDNLRRWHVVEAKGRSNSITKELINKSKDQARQVTSVNGMPPETSSACLTFFQRRRVFTRLIDPSPEDEGVLWTIDQAEFFRSYYESLTDYLLSAEKRYEYVYQDWRFIAARMPLSFDSPLLPRSIRIGLLDGILENPNAALDYARQLPENDYISRDGIVVTAETED